jgi:hypothetical protein
MEGSEKIHKTLDDLKEELKRFATKDDLKAELEGFATKEELSHQLELQAIRLEYHFDRKMDEKIDDLAQLTAQSFTDLYEYLDENFQRVDSHENKVAY